MKIIYSIPMFCIGIVSVSFADALPRMAPVLDVLNRPGKVAPKNPENCESCEASAVTSVKKIPLKPEEVLANTIKATEKRFKENNDAALAKQKSEETSDYIWGGIPCKQIPKEIRCILLKAPNFDTIPEHELRGVSKEELIRLKNIGDPKERARALNKTGLDLAIDDFVVATHSVNPSETLKRSLVLLKRPVDGVASGVLYQLSSNKLIVTLNGTIVDYASWLKTLRGLKVESTSEEETMKAKISLIPGEKVILPGLDPIHLNVFMERGAKPNSLPKISKNLKLPQPIVSENLVHDQSATILTLGNPDQVLSFFVYTVTNDAEIIIDLGHEKTGFAATTEIISNKGETKQSLVSWLQNIPGLKCSIKTSKEMNKVRQTATIKISDRALFEKYMTENPLTYLGNGKVGSDGLPTGLYLAE